MEKRLPLEAYEQLSLKDGEKPIQQEVKLIFDKNQALIRFPTLLNLEFKWREGDKIVVTVTSLSPPTLECKLVRG